ncbi:uncharacterized protein RAG0_09791 [Rhynchosporium agropyri]|uniref:Gylcosyl hydrolase 115 C-terminal domain-containing protein n=1 Tax=Rhynchosporium agropyri TaxID=914238 RepID=A0A1E1KZX4_9HELO|nr:uncharacterized protein RAG0_09791 [Rhynchosporium agropyri]
MKIPLDFLALGLSFFTLLKPAIALGQTYSVTTDSSQSASLLKLAGDFQSGQILLSADEWWGVLRAAEDLAGDFGKATGKNLTLGHWDGYGNSTRTGDVPSVNATSVNATRGDRGQSDVKRHFGGIFRRDRGEAVQTEKRSSPPPSGEAGERNPPTSSVHEHVVRNPLGVTVSYKYQPVTSFVNYTLGPDKFFTGPTLLSSSSASTKTVIIAGTIGKSSLIDFLIASGKLDVSPIRGKWESFISQVIVSPLPGVDRALVIAGSDLRGSVYGLYDVSEGLGVSPWYWWADVPVRKVNGVWAKGGKKVQLAPSIKFRGIYINDEKPALTSWIQANYADGQYGAGFNHFFYARVFELLLRLRANYLWPAMWSSMFNADDTDNQPLADAFGIVMGSSHTEPMLRADAEWNNFGRQYGGNGAWAYHSNNASIDSYFEYGAERAKPYAANSLFTVGLRGLSDSPIPLPDSEAIAVLEAAVKVQQAVLAKVFTNNKVSDIPQLWCLYKEVQGYYEQLGLTVPEHITLLWTDDNWGNIRRLPIGNETSRSGGAGVYYHFDYVGGFKSYKWINTIQLSKTVEQMQLAYARQADRVWIANVGDLKALEIPIEHFMDLAYDTPKWGYDSALTWMKLWAAREFGAEYSDAISSILDRYSMYAGRKKYELLGPDTYSILNYNEADAILTQWDHLANDAQGVYDSLEETAQPAFYELILHPVLGGQAVNQVYIWSAKNSHWSLQKRNSANKAAMDVLKAFKTDAQLTDRYHKLLGGKWNHMLAQTHIGDSGYWQQVMRNTAPPVSFVQDLETSLGGNIGVAMEGSDGYLSGDDVTLLYAGSAGKLVLQPMNPYGPKTRWIDIFARGTAGCDWTLSPSASYVSLSQNTGHTGGNNATDTRVFISVDWATAPAAPSNATVNINITSTCNWGFYQQPIIQVPIFNPSIPVGFTGFVESDRHISIEAEHASRNSTVKDVSYMTLSSYGRTRSGVTLMPVLAPTQPAGTGPVLEYDIFSLASYPTINITLHISSSMNQNGAARPLAYGIAFDAEAPQVVQFATGMGALGAAADGIWGLFGSGVTTSTNHTLSTAGKHTLKIWAVEPGVIFQKIIIDFGGVLKSNLGPPESFRAGVDKVGTYKGDNFAGVDIKDGVTTGN